MVTEVLQFQKTPTLDSMINMIVGILYVDNDREYDELLQPSVSGGLKESQPMQHAQRWVIFVVLFLSAERIVS